MTGRELIMFILDNHLENVDLITFEYCLYFPTLEEAAVELNVGVATVKAYATLGELDLISFNGIDRVVANSKYRFKIMTRTPNSREGDNNHGKA